VSEEEEIQIPRTDWLLDWDRSVDPRRLRSYVTSEVQRLIAEGQPVLHLAIMAPLSQQQDLTISVLREMGYRPRLRLRKGAVPPSVDAEGRRLPKEMQGKVLRAKVGYKGDDSSLRTDPIAASRFSGPMRNALARTEGLNNYRDVTNEPDVYSLEEAIIILRQHGVGVRGKRIQGKKRDTWLVEEVPKQAAQPEPRQRVTGSRPQREQA
jgi:hypothetical protein